MRTKVINLVGSPSSGKSLMSALLFAELKMMHKTAEYVQEYAKMLVWQGRLDELANQYNVTSEQYKMIKSVDGKVDYICTDSPLVLGLFYNRYHPENVCDISKTEKMILKRMSEFDNVYIFIEKNEKYPYETQGRIHNEQESQEIAIKLKELLNELGIPYKTFKSDKSNINEILRYIINC
jgi:nicotinamide riboside kinase